MHPVRSVGQKIAGPRRLYVTLLTMPAPPRDPSRPPGTVHRSALPRRRYVRRRDPSSVLLLLARFNMHACSHLLCLPSWCHLSIVSLAKRGLINYHGYAVTFTVRIPSFLRSSPCFNACLEVGYCGAGLLYYATDHSVTLFCCWHGNFFMIGHLFSSQSF